MTLEAVYNCPADHPALAGHFPGNPMVPGAVLLDQAIALAEKQGGWRVTAVRKARFKTPLPPETDCRLRLAMGASGTLSLTCSTGGQTVMTAIFECAAASELP